MPSLPFVYQDFQGGLNTREQAFLLADNQARDLSNVQSTTSGEIVKRGGLSTFASPAVTLTSVAAMETVNPSFLVGAGGTALYKISTGGTVTSIKTGLTSNVRWEFITAPVVSAQGSLFGMNGVDTPQQWDGAAAGTTAWTNASGGVAVPNGKYLIYANNQAFVAGVAATPSRLFWSALADPTNWDPASLTGAGFMDFDPNDGAGISAIGIVGPYVLVAKPRKLWVLIDPATASARRLSDNVGIIAHRSIASGPEGTYFLAEDRGVYLTNGSKLEPLSDIIQPTVDSIQPGLRSQAAGGYINNHYYLSVALNGASNDTTLDYDATLRSWWKHTIGSNQFEIWHPAGTASLFSAKATSAIVDQCFVPGVTVDNGSAFTWRWAGPWQSPTFYRRRRFPTPYFRKRIRQIRFAGFGTVDFSLAKDFTTSETLVRSNIFGNNPLAGTFEGSGLYAAADGSVWGDAGTIQPARVFSQGVADAFSLVFSATSTTQDSMNLYALMITDRRDNVPG